MNDDEESLVVEDWYYDSVTRVEVIDDSGRAYVKYDVQKVELSIQDDFKTLKVFIFENKDEEEE